jgi:hypothetical protein
MFTVPTSKSRHYRYPGLIACIAEGREATADELALVACRIRREAFPISRMNQTASAEVAGASLRAARFALSGS